MLNVSWDAYNPQFEHSTFNKTTINTQVFFAAFPAYTPIPFVPSHLVPYSPFPNSPISPPPVVVYLAMSSLVPGFEYDIFISYRQKDNKYDGWISDFVANLKRELEATFKDEVSVYFDENPHDGLLETHNVDKSLEGKLKCLILIPIISQTYCDPKSFAWQHEFCAFNKIAKEDQFGRDIKLRSGNVACRILPVKIHDLDADDKELLESELGTVLRPVDFIYKESGVNRPLRSNEENPAKNHNQTTYRNQINKVANSVKEIISSLKSPSSGSTPTHTTDHIAFRPPGERVPKRKRVFITTLLLVIAVAIGYFIFTKVGSSADVETLEKSIAVLPFEDLSPAGDQEWFSDGLSEDILNRLAQLPDFKVTARTSSFYFKEKSATIPEIAQKLGVVYVVEGSVRRIENQYRIAAQLVRARDGFQLWSKNYDGPAEKLFEVQDEIADGIATALVSKITSINKLLVVSAPSNQAYALYLKGRFYWDKRTPESFDSAENYYNRALELNPDYALAYTGLADCYMLVTNRKGLTRLELVPIAQAYVKKALAINSNLPEALTSSAFIQSHFEYDWKGAIPVLQKAISLNPNYPSAYLYYGNILFATGSTQEGIRETAKALELDPLSPSINWVVGRNYYYAGQYDLAIPQLKKTLAIRYYYSAEFYLGLCYMQKKEYALAIETFKKGMMSKMPVFSEEPQLLILNCYALSGDTLRAKAELQNFCENKNLIHIG